MVSVSRFGHFGLFDWRWPLAVGLSAFFFPCLFSLLVLSQNSRGTASGVGGGHLAEHPQGTDPPQARPCMSTGTEESESIRTGSDPNTSDDATRSPETVFYPVGQADMPAEHSRSSDACITTTKNGDRKSSDAAMLTLAGGSRPEDFSYRGVDLLTACVSGDLPLVAMLLGEGVECGVDMLAADAVRVSDVSRMRTHKTSDFACTIPPSFIRRVCTMAIESSVPDEYCVPHVRLLWKL